MTNSRWQTAMNHLLSRLKLHPKLWGVLSRVSQNGFIANRNCSEISYSFVLRRLATEMHPIRPQSTLVTNTLTSLFDTTSVYINVLPGPYYSQYFTILLWNPVGLNYWVYTALFESLWMHSIIHRWTIVGLWRKPYKLLRTTSGWIAYNRRE